MAQLMPLPLTVSCSSKIQIGFLVPADLGTPGKRAVKRVCVYARVLLLFLLYIVYCYLLLSDATATHCLLLQ